MIRDDYLLRHFRQLAEALARIVGLRSADAPQEALREVERAKRQLPITPGLLDQVAVTSLTTLLPDAESRAQLAELYRHEAELLHQLGDEATAIRRLVRSKALSAAANPDA